MQPRFDRDGKNWGILPVPHSSHESAYGQIEVPVGVIRNGAGPTILLVAGNHGDEYEGQFVLRRLFRETEPRDVSGRILIVPCANPPAVFASSRTSPLDQGNLNRLFPGERSGGPTAIIANTITEILLPLADYLVDLHSGGSSLEYLPSTIIQRVRDKKIYATQEDMARAFAAPLSLIYDALPGLERSLSGTAIGMGVPSIATELGGGGVCTPSTIEIGYRGVRGVLGRLGLLTAQDPRAAGETLFVDTNTDYLRSPDDGFFEPRAELGDDVEEGQIAGLLHRFSDLDEAPRPLRFGNAGRVVCRRAQTRSARGDCLFHTAKAA